MSILMVGSSISMMAYCSRAPRATRNAAADHHICIVDTEPAVHIQHVARIMVGGRPLVRGKAQGDVARFRLGLAPGGEFACLLEHPFVPGVMSGSRRRDDRQRNKNDVLHCTSYVHVTGNGGERASTTGG